MIVEVQKVVSSREYIKSSLNQISRLDKCWKEASVMMKINVKHECDSSAAPFSAIFIVHHTDQLVQLFPHIPWKPLMGQNFSFWEL